MYNFASKGTNEVPLTILMESNTTSSNKHPFSNLTLFCTVCVSTHFSSICQHIPLVPVAFDFGDGELGPMVAALVSPFGCLFDLLGLFFGDGKVGMDLDVSHFFVMVVEKAR